MRLVNFQNGKQAEFGVEAGWYIYSFAAAGYRNDLDFCHEGEMAPHAAHALRASGDAEAIPLESVRLLAPVLKPRKYCAWD